MQLRKIFWRNIGPYGNKLQEIEFSKEGGLWMVLGKNGHGKCHSKKTKLSVRIKDEQVKKQFLKFIKK